MLKVEKRDNGECYISGYVNAVDRDSRVLHDKNGKPFVEVVRPKTFQRALENAKDVELTYNHGKHIGSTSEGNLKLKEDNIGLYAEARIYDSEVIGKVDNLTGWSFTFESVKEDWEQGDNVSRRYLDDINLFEVSILDKTPAYIGTSVTNVEYRELETRLADLPITQNGEIYNSEDNNTIPYTVNEPATATTVTTTTDNNTVTTTIVNPINADTQEEITTDKETDGTSAISANAVIQKKETDNSILYLIKDMEIEIAKL